ncbi:MAG: CAP domain-containing protein, partial [Acidimicrobiales bacterium]
MRRTFSWVFLVTSTLIVFSSAPAGAATAAAEADYFASLDGLRSSLGAAPLLVDPGLAAGARDWAQAMADAGRISHDRSFLTAGARSWDKLAENVGSGATVEVVFGAFLASASHFRTMTDPSFTHVGVGVAWRTDGAMTAALRFARMVATPAPAPAVEPPAVETVATAAPAPTPARRAPGRAMSADPAAAPDPTPG